MPAKLNDNSGERKRDRMITSILYINVHTWIYIHKQEDKLQLLQQVRKHMNSVLNTEVELNKTRG